MVQSLYDLLTDNELDKNLLESSEKLKICVMSIFRKRELMIIWTHYVISSILHFFCGTNMVLDAIAGKEV